MKGDERFLICSVNTVDQVHLIILIIGSYKRDQCIVGLMMCKTGMRTVCHLDTKSVKMRVESIRVNSDYIFTQGFRCGAECKKHKP